MNTWQNIAGSSSCTTLQAEKIFLTILLQLRVFNLLKVSCWLALKAKRGQPLASLAAAEATVSVGQGIWGTGNEAQWASVGTGVTSTSTQPAPWAGVPADRVKELGWGAHSSPLSRDNQDGGDCAGKHTHTPPHTHPPSVQQTYGLKVNFLMVFSNFSILEERGAARGWRREETLHGFQVL